MPDSFTKQPSLTSISQSEPCGFEDLGLVPALLQAVVEQGYRRPTPIQCAAIPPVLHGRDVLGCAQTGTGKTAAFALPILQQLAGARPADRHVRALILSPTRELAAQILDDFAAYGSHLRLSYAAVFGGVDERRQIATLRRGVDVLVATPGRLLDLLDRGLVGLGQVRHLVLDEADRMLDMGFLPDVRRITAAVPKTRQTLLFSATMPTEIRRLADAMLRDPVLVAMSPTSEPVATVEQRVYLVDGAKKRRLLLDLVRDPAFRRTLVFSRTKHGANRVARMLEDGGLRAAAIHGNKSQAARVRALEGFRRGEVSVLVATDIAARGIDVDGVTHVINFDLPNVPETYVHRIGRTGRAGASGVALSFCGSDERVHLRDIERLLGRSIPRGSHELGASETAGAVPERDRSGARPNFGPNHRGRARGRRSRAIPGRAASSR